MATTRFTGSIVGGIMAATGLLVAIASVPPHGGRTAGRRLGCLRPCMRDVPRHRRSRPLGPRVVPFTLTDRELLTLVREGGGQMMAFSAGVISDDQVGEVATYLRSLEDGLAASHAASAPPSIPRSDSRLIDRPAARSWRRTLDGWGYSLLPQIDRGNVHALKLTWSWALEPGPSQTPLVHEGVMYVANPANVVHALDARTCELPWEYRREMDQRRRPMAQMRTLVIYQDLIILNTVDAHVVGLHVPTGAVRWATPVVPDGKGSHSRADRSSPMIVAGRTGCARVDEDTCYIACIDGRTGRVLCALHERDACARPTHRSDQVALPVRSRRIARHGRSVRASAHRLRRQELIVHDGQTGHSLGAESERQSLRAMAYHPDTTALYVALSLSCQTATFEAMKRREGGGGTGPVRVRRYDVHPKSPDHIGELQALDIRPARRCGGSDAARPTTPQRSPQAVVSCSSAPGIATRWRTTSAPAVCSGRRSRHSRTWIKRAVTRSFT